mmetsp:Transcript_22388/g.68947  ORF Transcript_22388/g.68947 Transcript_22388/m.68947 type:complete len:692 (+) Transcript_22388:68-2143(+)
MCDGVAAYGPDERYERALHYENSDVEDIYRRLDEQYPKEQMPQLETMVKALLENEPPTTEKQLASRLAPWRKKFKLSPRKAHLLHCYRSLVDQGSIRRSTELEEVLTTKASKSQSGVLVVTLLTSPYPSVNGGKKQRFTCEWNCYYCPNQPGQPRSYLRDEPAVLRANQNRFDAVMQFTERCATLAQNGHPVDKVELIVLGGTWSSYPLEYREAFCRDVYYAANTFWHREKRKRFSLKEEQELNETAFTKIIGLTLETRPDAVTTAREIRRLRSYGCTRVQLGVQHLDEAILKKVNRGHGRPEAAAALKLLKDCCYKVDVHLMPNLPGSSPAKDKAMFDAVLYDDDIQADQWKIYPCEVTPWTVIKKWFDEGSYVPYGEKDLFDVLVYVKSRVHPWIRLNRVVRDIPSNYILGGLDVPNMREDVLAAMRRAGKRCMCIRCREVGDITGMNQLPRRRNDGDAVDMSSRRLRRVARSKGPAEAAKAALRSRGNREGVQARRTSEKLAAQGKPTLVRRTYAASGGTEHFLSFETPDYLTIFGFLRLRLSDDAGGGVFESLENCALIRELHVYGQLVVSGVSDRQNTRGDRRTDFDDLQAQQHRGFGRRLMAEAERIARRHGYRKIAVISGVGTRGYYRSLGYVLDPDGDFLIKALPKRRVWTSSFLSVVLCCVLFALLWYRTFRFLEDAAAAES